MTGPALIQNHNLAERLNRHCACHFLDRTQLVAELEKSAALSGLYSQIQSTRPHLLSDSMVFVHDSQTERIARVVERLSHLFSSPTWLDRIQKNAPDIAHHDPGNLGLWLGFDFHLSNQGPELIEVNTNPGGLLLNLYLARAQRACCPDAEKLLLNCPPPLLTEATLIQTFLNEWHGAGRQGKFRHLVIVDEHPQEQYLYPEFLLFQEMFKHAGIDCHIAPPEALEWDGQTLFYQQQPVDLVYNRLTDFYLESPAHLPLRAAYQAGAVVLAPHPHAHARYASKTHLALLSQPSALSALAVEPDDIALFGASIPPTFPVIAASAEQFWNDRRQWFFKPTDGFGGRAAYRGDKLTRRVWQEILQARYVAQRISPPSRRRVHHDQIERDFKLDIRAYAYDGKVQLLAARLYEGQTTNFRTPGGGFAPVFVIPYAVTESELAP